MSDWYGDSFAFQTNNYGWAIIETPVNPVEPTRLLLPDSNVPFDTRQEAQTWMRTFPATVRYTLTVVEIVSDEPC